MPSYVQTATITNKVNSKSTLDLSRSKRNYNSTSGTSFAASSCSVEYPEEMLNPSMDEVHKENPRNEKIKLKSKGKNNIKYKYRENQSQSHKFGQNFQEYFDRSNNESKGRKESTKLRHNGYNDEYGHFSGSRKIDNDDYAYKGRSNSNISQKKFSNYLTDDNLPLGHIEGKEDKRDVILEDEKRGKGRGEDAVEQEPQNGVWDQLQVCLSIQAEGHIIATLIGSNYINKNNDLWKELNVLEEIQRDVNNNPDMIASKKLIEEKRQRREKAYEFLRKNVQREMLEEELTLLLLDFKKNESLRPKSEQAYNHSSRIITCSGNQSKSMQQNNKEENKKLLLERKIENYLLHRYSSPAAKINIYDEQLKEAETSRYIFDVESSSSSTTYQPISYKNLKQHEKLLEGLSTASSMKMNINMNVNNKGSNNVITHCPSLQLHHTNHHNNNYSANNPHHPSPPSTARSQTSTNRSAPPRLEFLQKNRIDKSKRFSMANPSSFSAYGNNANVYDDNSNIDNTDSKNKNKYFKRESFRDENTRSKNNEENEKGNASYNHGYSNNDNSVSLNIANIDSYINRIRKAFKEEEAFLLESIENLMEEINNDGTRMRKTSASSSKKEKITSSLSNEGSDSSDNDSYIDDELFLPSTQQLKEFRLTLKEKMKQVEHENNIQAKWNEFGSCTSSSSSSSSSQQNLHQGQQKHNHSKQRRERGRANFPQEKTNHTVSKDLEEEETKTNRNNNYNSTQRSPDLSGITEEDEAKFLS